MSSDEKISQDGNIKVLKDHKACAFAYICKTRGVAESDESLKEFRCYFGDDAADQFLESIRADAISFFDNYLHKSKAEPIVMNDEDIYRHMKATKCEFCRKSFTADENDGDKKGLVKVRNHWHTGYLIPKNSPNASNYLGALCQQCNLKTVQPKVQIASSHNLSYDIVLIFRSVAKMMTKYHNDQVRVTAKSMNKFISFSWMISKDDGEMIELRFIDSFRFNPASLSAICYC